MKPVFFIKNGEVHSSPVLETINRMSKVQYLEDRFLYVDKSWIFSTRSQAERRLLKYPSLTKVRKTQTAR